MSPVSHDTKYYDSLQLGVLIFSEKQVLNELIIWIFWVVRYSFTVSYERKTKDTRTF